MFNGRGTILFRKPCEDVSCLKTVVDFEIIAHHLILLRRLHYSVRQHNQKQQKMYTTFVWKPHEKFVKTDIIMVSLRFF